jgi:DNA polymerase (family 10)
MSTARKATTADVVAMLSELAKLTTLEEESSQSFKVRAYDKAVHAISGSGLEVTAMSLRELEAIEGVGRSIAEKIHELVDTGRVAKLEELRAKYPPAFVELTRIPGLGPKSLKKLRAALGIESLADLERAVAARALRDLPGFGAQSEEKLARAIERIGLRGKERRTPVADAYPLARRMVEEIRRLPGVVEAQVCGSLRRMAETVGDVDIVVAADEGTEVMASVVANPAVAEVMVSGDTKTSVLTREGLQVDVRVVAPDQAGAAALYFTGSKAHNIALRQRAIDRGYLLNEYGLFVAGTDEVVASRTEEEIYATLGLPLIPAPLREDAGEIAAAEAGELGDVVTLSDIRGDLHYHTDRSGDGRSTPEQMVQAAVERGYAYVAITDHGEDLAINGSSRRQMREHRRRITALADRHPGITLLFGCELNIGPAGGLDYDLEFRMGLDWCVASVHSHFDLPAAEQTSRLLRAIADPSVNAIGHLTGRYIGRRPGIEIDLDPILEALAESGVALEVNGALERLDASAEVVRRAVRRGVKLVIVTDSHHISELGRMEHGVSTAQRGWARRTDVLNTLPVEEFLAAARVRRG